MSRPLRSALLALAVLVALVALGPAAVSGGVASGTATGTGGHVAVGTPFCPDAATPVGVLSTAPAGDGLLVSANLTVAGEEPSVGVRERGDGTYVLVVDTATRAADCRRASTVSVTRRLPADAERVAVVVNGQRVGSVAGVGAASLS